MLKHKFKAQVSYSDGIRFSSKKERKRYDELKFLQEQGEVLFFLRQVPFHLQGGVKYICDFMVFWKNNDIDFEDVKGFKTDMYKVKKKFVETIYPINIKEI